MNRLSIILPAKNESAALVHVLPQLKQHMPNAEIIVVDDGSTDETVAICEANHVHVISRPYSVGNGAAIKTGARAAKGDVLLFMDADGQHKPEDVLRLLQRLEQGYDMVVGARSKGSQASLFRGMGNRLYNRLATWMTGQKILDLTSGFRAVNAAKFRQFLYLLPNGFSYPTTITMSFFRAGYSVTYVPIDAPKRIGTSHLRIFRDGVRFLLIIFKVGTLYSPLKLFFPISLGFFGLGALHYLYTFLILHRFTNMSTVLFITSMLVFLVGLVSEQITALSYRDSER